MPRQRKPPRLYHNPKNGRWEIRDGDRYIRTRSVTQRGEEAPDEAKQALADYLSENVAAASEGPQSPRKVLVGDILAFYAEHVRETVKSAATLAYSIQALAPFWSNLTAEDVSGHNCRVYVKTRNRANATVRRELGVLQAALNVAYREKLVSQPIPVTLPRPGQPKDRWLTRKEVAKLLCVSQPHMQRFLLIAVYTGTRKSAILGLRWKRNPSHGWIDVEEGVIHRKGWGEDESNKRRGSVRMVPQLWSLAKQWSRDNQPWVIHFKGEPIRDVRTAMAAACVRAEIEAATPHDLKRTSVTWGFQNGMSMEDAVDFYATSYKTLEAVYRQHSPHYQNRAVGIMSRRKVPD